MKFSLGDYVKVPMFGIDKGVVTGIEDNTSWVVKDGNLKRDGSVADYDYKVAFVKDGKVFKGWYGESHVEAFYVESLNLSDLDIMMSSTGEVLTDKRIY